MTDIVERLRRIYDKAMDENLALAPVHTLADAAAEIERLRAETVALRQSALQHVKEANRHQARLAEAEALLHRVYFASRIDVLMEGPRLQGWSRPELDRLWPDLRDLVAKLEQKP